MICNCNSCPYVHKTTALTADGVLTVTNPNNIGNFDPFCLIVTIDPNSVITGAPVETTITINGTAVPIWDIWGYPVTTDRLKSRCRYKGRYVIPTGGTTHLTLTSIPADPEDILRTISLTGNTSASTTTSEG